MIIEFILLHALSAFELLSRIFWFIISPMRKYLKPRPDQSSESEDQSLKDQDVESNEEKKRKEPSWKKYSEMPISEKRRHYRCGQNYVTVSNIPTWEQYWKDNAYHFSKKRAGKKQEKPLFKVNESLNNKVSLWRGDITVLEIDAIVNAANSTLLGGGGVDGCIHRAAGETLRKECAELNGCDTGQAKITSGHKLPAKHVIHTVGPIGEKKDKLTSSYENCLKLVKENNIKTVAFCCISTGIYGYPSYSAAMVALETVRRWLESSGYADEVQRIIFCTFLQNDVDIYENLLPRYFPSAYEIVKKDQTEEQRAEGRDDQHGEEDAISKGKPEPPTKEELLSDEPATEAGMTSDQENTEMAKENKQGDEIITEEMADGQENTKKENEDKQGDAKPKF